MFRVANVVSILWLSEFASLKCKPKKQKIDLKHRGLHHSQGKTYLEIKD